MKGIDLAKTYFEKYGKELLNKFIEEKNKFSIVFMGHGSECFFFDDEISQDHDFDPSFTVITIDNDSDFYKRMKTEYEKLPNSSNPYKGVITCSDYYKRYTGVNHKVDPDEFVLIPDYLLAEATNGVIFYDGLKDFSDYRAFLINMPYFIRNRRMAEYLFNMGQSGQYNYYRCFRHQEYSSMCLALNIFIDNALSLFYLFNNKYKPYYKWAFRGTRDFTKFKDEVLLLEEMIKDPSNFEANINKIEKISNKVIEELKMEGLSNLESDYLVDHSNEIDKY